MPLYCDRCKKEVPETCPIPQKELIIKLLSAPIDCEGKFIHSESLRSRLSTINLHNYDFSGGCFRCGGPLRSVSDIPVSESTDKPTPTPKPKANTNAKPKTQTSTKPTSKPRPKPVAKPQSALTHTPSSSSNSVYKKSEPKVHWAGCFGKSGLVLGCILLVYGIIANISKCSSSKSDTPKMDIEEVVSDIEPNDVNVIDDEPLITVNDNAMTPSKAKVQVTSSVAKLIKHWDSIDNELNGLGSASNYVSINSHKDKHDIRSSAHDKYLHIKDKAYSHYRKIKDEAYKEYQRIKNEEYEKYRSSEIEYSDYFLTLTMGHPK